MNDMYLSRRGWDKDNSIGPLLRFNRGVSTWEQTYTVKLADENKKIVLTHETDGSVEIPVEVLLPYLSGETRTPYIKGYELEIDVEDGKIRVYSPYTGFSIEIHRDQAKAMLNAIKRAVHHRSFPI